MTSPSAQVSSSSALTDRELSAAENDLISSRDNLLACVRDLSDAQWHFRPAPDRWSIAEILEHVVLVEERLPVLLGRMGDAPAADPGRVNSQIEEIIRVEVPNRSSKFPAPPPVQPSHRWTPADAVDRFVQIRSQTLKLLFEASFLRGHVLPHPVLGNWDGYQWILAVAAHSARHTNQMLEVKSCREFPGTNAAEAVSLH